MTGQSAPRDQGGATTLEAVLAFPVLLLLVMFIIQVALWYHTTELADAAAQDGVRAARVEGATAADGIDRANQVLDQTGRTILQARQVSAVRDRDAARVEVRGDCISLVPFMSLPVHAVAESSTEQFRGRLLR